MTGIERSEPLEALVARIVSVLDVPVGGSVPVPTTEGQGRSAFVLSADGRELVVKWSAEPRWIDWLPSAVTSTARLRSRGYPTARTVAFGMVPEVGAAWVQERLPGAPLEAPPTAAVLEGLLGAIELQADADHDVVDPSSLDWVRSVVRDDAAGWWRSARSTSAAVDSACDDLIKWLAAVPLPLQRCDWTHLDLNFGNVLALDGCLTGIVDTDHLGFGDRAVDLAYLVFEHERAAYASGRSADSTVVDCLRAQALQISGEPGWRLAVGYCAISSLGWVGPAGARVPSEMAVAVMRRVLGLG